MCPVGYGLNQGRDQGQAKGKKAWILDIALPTGG